MPDKTAAAEYEILDLIARRWSPRAFSTRSVEPEQLHRLFEAGRWAPSCFNEQPWSFLIGRAGEGADHEKLAACLSPGNAWARSAPVLALSVASLDFARNGKPNRHAYHDVGMAVENLVLQALSMGIFAHQMAGFQADLAREMFQIPPRQDPVAMIALGYPGDPGSLPDEQREKERAPRQRKPTSQFVFSGTWGAPWLPRTVR